MANFSFNLKTYRDEFLAGAVRHYAKTAPTVSNHADDLYVRLGGNGKDVTLYEICRMQELRQDDTWMTPDYAANLVYHLRDILKMDTSGDWGY